MVRLQVRLTERQSAELKRLAAERGVSVARIVRDAVDTLLRLRRADCEERKRRALSAIGRFRGPRDLSARHDDYFNGSITPAGEGAE